MSILPLNRYWGDEPEQKLPDGTETFQNLLHKIEERKRKRFENESNLYTTINSTIYNDDKKHRKKCRTVEDQFKIKSKEYTESTQDDNFTILEGVELKTKQKIKDPRYKPAWFNNAEVVSANLKDLTTSIFDILDLDKSLISQLQRNNITHFFPVQKTLIPWLLSCHGKYQKFWPRDVCVSAPTGSGKTLAFVLPIVQILKSRVVKCVRALIVLPSKDLAFQVYNVFKQYIVGTDLKAICLGNTSLEVERKKIISEDKLINYSSLVDIVVTTPGRLIEHLKYTKEFSLSHLQFLVIDEADRVMKSMQNDWMYYLRSNIPPFDKNIGMQYLTLSNVSKKPVRSQKLLFSATLSTDPEKLQCLGLFHPRSLISKKIVESDNNGENKFEDKTVNKFSTPAELSQYYTVCSLPVKPLVLFYLIKNNNWKRILCFADSASNVHKIMKLLRLLNNYDKETKVWNIVEISSKISQNIRRQILNSLSKDTIEIVVTTDTLARGIDIPDIDCVILYDVPLFAKNYIHRTGRTARAGKEGTSVVILTEDQENNFQEIVSTLGNKNINEIYVQSSDLQKLEMIYKASLNSLRIELKKEKQNVIKRRKITDKNKYFKLKKKLKG